MKILFLINSIKVGGAEKVFVNQANALQEMGFDIYFGVLEEKRGHLSFFDNLRADKYFCFDFKSLYDLGVYKRILKTINDHQIEIIYSTLPAANLIARIVKIFKPKLRVIIREANVADIKNLKLRIADILLLPWTDKIIAVSEAAKKSLERYLFLGRGKIEVINNGISLPQEINQETTAQLKKKYGLDGKYIILNVGSMYTEQKGQIFALKSLNKLVKDYSCQDLKLVLVGGQPKKEWIDFVKENHLESFVDFPGYLPPEEVNKLYYVADLFILPSLWEGFPNVVLEAMAHGCPVVAADVGGIRELISNNDNGLIVKPKDDDSLTDGILKIKDNPSLADFFIENSLKRIKEKFLFEAILLKLIKVLSS